ncbi:hypothetical protein BEH94_03825 [Candidatus Altiarchaeales archaeon WOR_SM1_SCG]|nr:hypothetical protein BEH94_03825 [Candidatus Altiarchaeales archaeon WOR_SM1_SCG]
MNTEKMLLWALAICVGIVTILSVPKYILGGDAFMPLAIQIFSFLLGAAFVLYLLIAFMNKSWSKYSGSGAIAFWAGIIAVGLLCLTGLLILMATLGMHLPQWLAQSVVPLRALTFWVVIAVGIILLSLMLFPKKSTA